MGSVLEKQLAAMRNKSQLKRLSGFLVQQQQQKATPTMPATTTTAQHGQ